MAYTQGTKVRLDVTVIDTDTGQPSTPSTLTCRIQDPNGNVTDQTLTTGLVELNPGQYRAIMDTSPAPKIWSYEWIADLESFFRGQINVRANLPAPA